MKKLLSLALLCCVILAMQAQSWSRVFNPSVTGDDEFFGVAPAPNGYIMAGTMRNAANTDTDGWITRIDNTGATVWSRQLQMNNTNEVLYDVIQLSNGNYITVGYTEGTTRNALVVCFNANGVVQWNRTMNFGMNTETFSTAIQITGGNIMLAGGGGASEGYVLACVTPTGNVVWRQSDESAGGTDWIQHLLQTSDGSVAFCGFSLSGRLNSGGHSLWIGKIDPANGNFHWSRTYSSGSTSSNQTSTGLIELPGQDLLCVGMSDAGNTAASNTAARDITFTRIKAVTGTTTQGDVVFSRKFDNNNMSDNAYAFARTANNQIVIGGTTNVNGAIGSAVADMFIATFDTAANFVSGGRYGLGFDDEGQRLCLSGNNVLINGFSRSFLNSGAASATSSDRKGYAIQVPLNQLTSVCTANTLTFTQNTFAQTEDVLTYTAVQLDAIDSVNMDPLMPTVTNNIACGTSCVGFNATHAGNNTVAGCGSTWSIALANATFPATVAVTGPTNINTTVNATPFTLTGLCVGTYTAIITSAAGCKDTILYAVENVCQGFDASRSVTTAAYCASSATISLVNANFPVNVAVTGTNGGTSSNISVNSSPFTLNNLCPGSYTVILTTNLGCKDTLKWTVENLCQGFNVTVTGINLAYPACNSSTNILISGGASSLPATVQTNWSYSGAPAYTVNTNAHTIMGECPETYYTIVTNALGCKDTIYYAIPQCVDTAICVGSSIILSAWDDKFHAPFTTGNQITGNWQTNGVASGSGATLTISPTANTNYIFNGQLNNVVSGVSTFVRFVNFCVNVNLTTPPQLTATASPATICAGQTSTLSVMGGAMNAMYRWYRMPATNLGTGMTKVVSPSVTTTYYAIVDCVPCTDTVWVTVNVVQPTQATITGPTAICGTQAVSLTATGGGTYAWKLSPFASIVGTAATLNVASVSTTRTYTVTATNAPCPTTTASHTINVNPIPNLTLPLPTGCRIVGQPLTFNATSTSNIATWNWGNNPNTPTGVTSTANTSAATYTMVSGTNTNIVSLSVTDVNGCSKSTSVSVSPNNLVATIAQPTQSGACNSRQFTVSLSGLTSAAGTVVSYNWVFKNITQNTQVTQTTTTNTATQLFAAPGIDVYEVCVTLTTSLGCTTSVCMTPNLPACSCNIAANFCTTAGTPPASGTAIPVIFNNTSTGGGATGLQYVWNWGDGTPNTTLTTTTAYTHNFASTLTSSNVELTVTGTSNGMQCCQKVNIPVTIPRPCPITSTNVTGFNYRQNATGSITFYSNIVAPTGCVYSWNFGNSTTSTAVSPTYTYPVAGTYTACLTITHTATGCSKTFCQSIIAAPAPNCNLIPRYIATRCTGAPLDISFSVVNNTSGIAPSNVTYSWTFGDGTSDVSTSPSISHTFPSTGNYIVCLQKVTANCTTNVCHTFNVQMPTYANCSPAPTGLKTTKGDDKGNEEELVPLDGNNWLLNKVEIVPNPAKNITNLHFSLANNAEVRMEAYSMEGKGIWEKTTSLSAGQQNEEINLSGWAAGMYIIRVTTGEEVQNIKLVVEN